MTDKHEINILIQEIENVLDTGALSQEKTHELELLLTPNSKRKRPDEDKAKDVQCSGAEIGDLYYSFDDADTLASVLFSEKTCEWIAWYRHNRVVQVTYALFVAGWIFQASTNQYDTVQFHIFIISGSALSSIPFHFSWILAANKYAFKMVATTFEFWIKVSQVTAFLGCVAYIYAMWMIPIYGVVKYPAMNYVYQAINSVSSISVVALTSAFDAVPHIDRRFQVAICAMICVIYFAASITTAMNLIHGELGDFTVIRVTDALAFSVAEIQMNMSRTISLFYAKQAVNLYMRVRAKSDKAVSVKYAPIIEWTSSKDEKYESDEAKERRASNRRGSIQIDVKTRRLSLMNGPAQKHSILVSTPKNKVLSIHSVN